MWPWNSPLIHHGLDFLEDHQSVPFSWVCEPLTCYGSSIVVSKAKAWLPNFFCSFYPCLETNLTVCFRTDKALMPPRKVLVEKHKSPFLGIGLSIFVIKGKWSNHSLHKLWVQPFTFTIRGRRTLQYEFSKNTRVHKMQFLKHEPIE